MSSLTSEQEQILRFEQKCEAAHVTPGAVKDDVIVDTFDVSPAEYYRRLSDLLDDTDAMAADPLLVGRLRRVRDSRSAAWRMSAPSGVVPAAGRR